MKRRQEEVDVEKFHRQWKDWMSEKIHRRIHLVLRILILLEVNFQSSFSSLDTKCIADKSLCTNLELFPSREDGFEELGLL